MTLSTLVEMDWLLRPTAAHSLQRVASSVDVWQQAIETLLVQLRGVLDAEKYVYPHVDVDLITEPLSFTAIDSSPAIRDVAVSPSVSYQQIVDESGASTVDRSNQVKVWSSLPETWRSDHTASRPPSASVQRTTADGSGSDVENDRLGLPSSNLKSRALLNNSVQLLLILRRYAARLSDLSRSRSASLKSRDMRVSLNVKMNVEKLEKLHPPDARLPTRPATTPGKKVAPFLIKKKPGGSSGQSGRASPGPHTGQLDKLGRQAIRKLESWVGEGATTNIQHVKIDLSRGVKAETIRRNDKASLDKRTTVNDAGRAEKAPDKNPRPVWNQLMQTLHSTPPEYVRRLDDRRTLEQPAMIIQTLERIVEKLVDIETRYVELAAGARQDAEDKEPAIEWLSDDDLAARLQTILKRQARRRGIDLS
jgi:hypothetical protein